MRVEVRPAAERDLEAMLEIYNHAIATTTAVFQYQPHTLQDRKEWFNAKQTAGLPILVADASGTVVGFASYGPFRAWPAYKYTIEHSVYVSEHARGRGVGTALVQAVLADAKSRDYHAVVAGIVADNIASLRLHTALGFMEVAHFREVGFKFGRWLDLKFLQLLFATPLSPKEP
jgi:L-amino acid N-acyltransferase YncA